MHDGPSASFGAGRVVDVGLPVRVGDSHLTRYLFAVARGPRTAPVRR